MQTALDILVENEMHIVVATSPSVSTGPTTSSWLLGTPWEPETADPMEICPFHIRLRASASLQNLTPNGDPLFGAAAALLARFFVLEASRVIWPTQHMHNITTSSTRMGHRDPPKSRDRAPFEL